MLAGFRQWPVGESVTSGSKFIATALYELEQKSYHTCPARAATPFPVSVFHVRLFSSTAVCWTAVLCTDSQRRAEPSMRHGPYRQDWDTYVLDLAHQTECITGYFPLKACFYYMIYKVFIPQVLTLFLFFFVENRHLKILKTPPSLLPFSMCSAARVSDVIDKAGMCGNSIKHVHSHPSLSLSVLH